MLMNEPREDIEELLEYEPVPEEDRVYYLTPKEFDSPKPRARVLGEMEMISIKEVPDGVTMLQM